MSGANILVIEDDREWTVKIDGVEYYVENYDDTWEVNAFSPDEPDYRWWTPTEEQRTAAIAAIEEARDTL